MLDSTTWRDEWTFERKRSYGLTVEIGGRGR